MVGAFVVMNRASGSVHEQGTPVKFRDGPAAVNCRNLRVASQCFFFGSAIVRDQANEKAMNVDRQ